MAEDYAAIDQEQFAYWIQGYQKFYEPIVRAWFVDRGYRDVEPESIQGEDLIGAADALKRGEIGGGLDESDRQRYIAELRRRGGKRGCRVQVDMVARLRDDTRLAIGEFKSWGGMYDEVTWKIVENEFVGESKSLFMMIPSIKGHPVWERHLVLWEKSSESEHERIEENLLRVFGVEVKVHYLNEIYSNLGQTASATRDQHLCVLNRAVEEVRKALAANG